MTKLQVGLGVLLSQSMDATIMGVNASICWQIPHFMKHVDLNFLSRPARLILIISVFWYMIPTLQAEVTIETTVDCVCVNPTNNVKGNKLIRIAGRMVEKSSQKPLDRAAVMVSCGKLVLASKRANENGEFLFYIPLEKVSQNTIELRVQYLDHVFVKNQLEPVDQEMLIEVNEGIFRESQTFDDYKVPTHQLGLPTVGHVYIRS